MDENKTTVETGNTQEEQPKTFTQEEVNAIVGKRLYEEKSKFSDYESLKEKASKFDEIQEANKTELEKANDELSKLKSQLETIQKENELKALKDKVSQELGVPSELLTATTEETMKSQAQAILKFAKPNYPSVKDGGEVNPPSSITKEDILKIKNERERVRMIEAHIDLFK